MKTTVLALALLVTAPAFADDLDPLAVPVQETVKIPEAVALRVENLDLRARLIDSQIGHMQRQAQELRADTQREIRAAASAAGIVAEDYDVVSQPAGFMFKRKATK